MWRWRTADSGVTTDLLGVVVWRNRAAIAVGRAGVCIELDGDSWRASPTGTSEDLYAVWGATPDDLLVVGGNLAIGRHSLVCRRRAGAWQESRSGVQSLLLSVAGSPRGEVRGAGFNGAFVERVGDTWREISAATNEHILCVRGLASNEWALCGINGLLQTSAQGAWRAHDVGAEHLTSLVQSVQLDHRLTAVGFNGAIVEQRADGWSMTRPTTRNLWSICAMHKDRIVVGDRGTLLLHDGHAWTSVATAVTDDLLSISGSDDFVVAVGKRGAVLIGER